MTLEECGDQGIAGPRSVRVDVLPNDFSFPCDFNCTSVFGLSDQRVAVGRTLIGATGRGKEIHSGLATILPRNVLSDWIELLNSRESILARFG